MLTLRYQGEEEPMKEPDKECHRGRRKADQCGMLDAQVSRRSDFSVVQMRLSG